MERGQKLAEHVEDYDARQAVLDEQLAVLDDLAKLEGWREEPRYEGAVRKVTREFHLGALLEARERYHLSEENVKRCWAAIWAKLPAHPDEPADAPDGE